MKHASLKGGTFNMEDIKHAVDKLAEAKDMVRAAEDNLCKVLWSHRDMPLHEAISAKVVRFNFAVPRHFKESFTQKG